MLVFSCIFLICTSILFLRSRIIFTIINLNSFSCRFPVFTSRSCFSYVLSLPFTGKYSPSVSFVWLSVTVVSVLSDCRVVTLLASAISLQWMRLSKRLMQTFLPTGGWRCVLSLWCVELLFPPCWLFGLKHLAVELTHCWVRPAIGEKWWAHAISHKPTMACSLVWAHYHRLMPMSTPQSYHHQCLCLCSEPLTLPLTSIRDPPILMCRFGPGSYEVSALISLCPGVHENFFWPLHESVSVSSIYVEFLQ